MSLYVNHSQIAEQHGVSIAHAERACDLLQSESILPKPIPAGWRRSVIAKVKSALESALLETTELDLTKSTFLALVDLAGVLNVPVDWLRRLVRKSKAIPNPTHKANKKHGWTLFECDNGAANCPVMNWIIHLGVDVAADCLAAASYTQATPLASTETKYSKQRTQTTPAGRYRGYLVNSGNGKGNNKSRAYISVLDAVIGGCDAAFKKYESMTGLMTVVNRLDENSDTIRRLKRAVSRCVGISESELPTITKIEKTSHRHAHVLFLWDSKAKPYAVVKELIANEIAAINGDRPDHELLVYVDTSEAWGKKSFHNVTSKQALSALVYHASYLAKEYSSIRNRRQVTMSKAFRELVST